MTTKPLIKPSIQRLGFKLITITMACLSFTVQASTTVPPCGNNEIAAKLIDYIKNHENQQRDWLSCNQSLNEIAKIKAQFIIESQDIWHNAGHMTPNQLLRHHGFKLPKTYPLFGNQVEALAGGEDSAEEVFDDFINSEPHRKLLFGEDDFFKTQDQIGAAFIKDLTTDHQFYWVVIIADEKQNKMKQDPVIEVEPPVFSTKKRKRGREIKEKMYQRKVRNTKFN